MITLQCKEARERQRWSLRRRGRSGDPQYAVELYFDRDGLEEFLERLQLLRDEWLRDETDNHFHCMTPAWGGPLDLELSEEPQHDWAGAIVHSLTVRIA
jgi:hypothetical protein